MRSQIGDELYALPPSAFTAARDSQVAQARRDGDKAGAAELAALKRPTQAGWLVNLLALRRPDVVAGLIELGDTIRAAQGSVPPTQLRDLSAQRRKALDAALAECTALARSADQPTPTRAQLDEVEATLAAAMADDDAAAQVRAGRVLKSLHYSGFGDAFGFGATATGAARPASGRPTGTGTRRAAPTPDAEAAQKAEAEARRAAAAQRLAESEQALDTATATERTANSEVERLTDELAALREALEHAQLAARTARQARQAAERDVESAHRRLRAATP